MADEKETEKQKKPSKKLTPEEIEKPRSRFVARAEDFQVFATKEEALEASRKRKSEIEAFMLRWPAEAEARRKAKALEDPDNAGQNEIGAFKQQLLREAEAKRQARALKEQQTDEANEEDKLLPDENEH